MHRLMNIV